MSDKMELPAEWFAASAGKYAVYWRVDEDCEIEVEDIKHSTVFLDSDTVAHMAALVAIAKREHEND